MPTKKQPAKKPVTKKAPAKTTASKVAPKRPVKSARKSSAMRSFVATRPSEPFLTFRITNQTLYWLILAAFVLILGVWVTVISIRVQNIYDSIDATNTQADLLTLPSKTPAKR